MKLPDKIYLGVGPMSGDEPNKRYIYAEWNEEPRSLVQNIAYIRKDALLEWAKGELSHADANIEAYPYENAFRGHREKIEELIEHIESL